MNNETGPIFYVNREDGFGARLNAVINAIALADHFNGRFAFSWEEKQRDGFLHSIQSRQSVFSPEFNRKYYASPKQIQGQNAAIDLNKYLRRAADARNALAKRDEVVIDVGSNLPERWLELVGEESNREILRASFAKIEFNPDLATVVERAHAVDLGESSIALHLRAGDVVYANAKYKKSIGKKAVPYQLAWQYLKDRREEGKTVILFGQDMPLCRALAKQENAVLCADILDQDWTAFQRELFEITLISRCNLAVGGESSFLRIATAAAGKEPDSIYDIYPAARRQLIILGSDVPDSVNQAASDGQKLYSLWMVAADLFEDQNTDVAQLLSVTEKAQSYIPDDDFMRICRACMLGKVGRFADAETLISNVAEGEGNKPLLGRVRPSHAIEDKMTDFLNDAVADNRPWASALQLLLSAAKAENSLAVAAVALKDKAVSDSPWRRQILDAVETRIRKTAEDPIAANAQVRAFKRSLKANGHQADKPAEIVGLAEGNRKEKAGGKPAYRRNAVAGSAGDDNRQTRKKEHKGRGARKGSRLSRMMTTLRRFLGDFGRRAK